MTTPSYTLLTMPATPEPVTESVVAPVTPKGRRTRDALIEAGVAVAERDGLAGLSAAAVAREAGGAKGTFYIYFDDRDSFIDGMHQRFYTHVSEAVSLAVADLAPGRE